MGTYAYCLGEMDIPEEHRAEYARQVLEILRAGGMMTVEELPLYRKKIYLLSPPELDEEGQAKGYYNYFERTSWESWGLSAKRGDSQGRFSFGREPPLRDPKRNTRGKPLDLPLPVAAIPMLHALRKALPAKKAAAFDLVCFLLRFAAPLIVNQVVLLIV